MESEPEAYHAMGALEKYAASTPVSKIQKELIKIRASQINSCAYCIQMHTADARKAGETEQRIYALSAWQESPLFSDEERVLLAMTEEITLIADKGLSEETYQAARAIYDEQRIAQLIMLIVTINSWNRIAVATHLIHK